MPRIVQFNLPPGGTVVDLADNQTTALEIEGVDSKDYVVVKTTDGSESITLKAGGSGTVINESGQMKSTASGGWMLVSSDPTDTVPNIMPSMSDPNTGIGHYGGTSDSDALSLIAGGVEGVRIVEDSSAATIQFGQDNYDPMIQQASGTAAGSVGYSFKADTDTGLSSGGESNSLQLVVGTIPAIHCRKDDDTGVAYVGIGGSAYDASVNNTLLQLNGDSDEAELAFKLSGGTTTTMGYRGQAIFSIDANGGIQFRNQGGSLRSEVTSSGTFTNYHDAIQTKFVDDTSFLTHEFRKSRAGGAGSHVIVNDNDTLGKIKFTGSDGNSYAAGAEIFARVNGTPGDGSMPTELVFSTTGSGTETASERIYIRQNGNVGINDSAPNYQLANVGTKSVPLLLSSNSSTSAIGTTYTSLPNGSAAALFDHRVGDSIYLQNNTAENTADGRETGIGFFGRVDLATDEYHYQGAIRCKHEGSAADQKGYLQFLTNDGDDNRNIQERMRITSAGYVGINHTNPTKYIDVVGDVKFSANALSNIVAWASNSSYRIDFGATDSASKLNGPLAFEVTSDPTGIADCAEIYAKDVDPGGGGAVIAELFARDEGGNITQLSPHNFQLFEPDASYSQPWSYTSKNSYIGKEIGVDMFGLVKAVEELSGKTLMYERDLPDEEVKDWYIEQGRIQAARENAISEWDASKAANDGGISSDQPRPEPYTIKDPPDWLKSRLKLDSSH